MQYLIDHFFKPGAEALQVPDEHGYFASFTFNHVLNGVIDAQGEEHGDIWRLVVKDNIAQEVRATITYPEVDDDE